MAILCLLLQSNTADSCRRFTNAQIIKKLKAANTCSPLGGFNPRFMTLSSPFLMKGFSGSRSTGISQKCFRFTQKGGRRLSVNCVGITDDGFTKLCSECHSTTDLGWNKFPRYINEVKCGSSSFCLRNHGRCRNKVIHQTFFIKNGRCGSSGLEHLQPYRQRISIGCECVLPSFFRLGKPGKHGAN